MGPPPGTEKVLARTVPLGKAQLSATVRCAGRRRRVDGGAVGHVEEALLLRAAAPEGPDGLVGRQLGARREGGEVEEEAHVGELRGQVCLHALFEPRGRGVELPAALIAGGRAEGAAGDQAS
jgi:hypothetical protein